MTDHLLEIANSDAGNYLGRGFAGGRGYVPAPEPAARSFASGLGLSTRLEAPLLSQSFSASQVSMEPGRPGPWNGTEADVRTPAAMSKSGEFVPEGSIIFGHFVLSPAKRLLEFQGSPVQLGSRAFDILTALVEWAGTVVSKKELMARGWPGLNVDEAALRFQIAALRKSLKDGQNGNRYIATVPGRGYCFVRPTVRGGSSQTVREVSGGDNKPRPHGLPVQLKRMVGRSDVVREVSARLLEDRFITIKGEGGIGKTTLAIAVAQELAPMFGGGVLFVDLSQSDGSDLVSDVLATAFCADTPTPDPLASLSAFVRDKRFLLVLDNCEHVIGAIASLAEKIFKSTPGLHILATSREALHADGEQVYRLRPLRSPAPDLQLSAEEALTYPAIQLFIERAAASGARIRLSDAEAPVVSGICSRLDGIALAIELAASRVGIHGLAGTAGLLDSRIRLDWHGNRTAQPRHRTLYALLDWSYNLLSDNERLVLCRLSAFSGGFTLQAACAVGADGIIDDDMVVAIVGDLVEKSLVSTVIDAAGSVTYRLLETTRAYALEKLEERDEADTAA